MSLFSYFDIYIMLSKQFCQMPLAIFFFLENYRLAVLCSRQRLQNTLRVYIF